MAYAVVVSVKQILEPLLDSARSRFQIPNSELKPIYDQLCYVKFFLDKMISLEDSNTVGDLEKQIKDVVQKAQDLIEFHLSDLVHSRDETSISGLSLELGEVNRKLASLVKMLKGKERYLTGEQLSPAGVGNGRNSKTVGLADVDDSSTIDFSRNAKVVGLDDELLRLLEWLTGMRSYLEVICIAGMAGIGKTTLAKTVYLHPHINEHFDICLFVEIGVEYQLKNLLMRLLGQLVSVEMKKLVTVGQLGERLFKFLFGRRYLVVLDDIWDTSAWDQIRLFFPDMGNGSRIIYTTTGVTELANGMILQKRFLDDHESWELFCKMVFFEEACPMELVEMGKTIVEKLGGHPLAIVMIGKHLSKLERKVEIWMAVAQNPISLLWEIESTIPEFLNVCYTQLPQRLKACFLYLGLFPPNYSIPTSQLIRLWVAEGFIEHVPDKSLEQKGKEYLEGLVSRSLVIVDQLSSSRRIKTCRIHQLVHALCVSEARQQKLFHIVNEGTTKVTKNQRRLSILCSDIVPGAMESVLGLRSLVFMQPDDQYQLPVFVRFRWLRVLHALSIRFGQFPDAVLKLVRLRYLAIVFDGELPPSISRLWNLEVLIIHATQIFDSSMFLPLEIWQLHKLRHLECTGFDLPDPSAIATRDGYGYGDFLFLKKLLTLSGVSPRTCTEVVLARVPNLIKLRIDQTNHAVEISCFHAVYTNLHHLESFNCALMNRYCIKKPSGADSLERLTNFPYSLIKLSLGFHPSQYCWEDILDKIGELPLLQKLTLIWGTFKQGQWETTEGKFLCLKSLAICRCMGLEVWVTESSHFPSLERLVLCDLDKLQEIPLDFGDIPTLGSIEVNNCSKSAVISAKRILEEQEDLYGEEATLQVRVMLYGKNEDLEGLASPNFCVVKD